MTPKIAAERKAIARYWPHADSHAPRATNDEILRAQRLERERKGMDLTAQLMGDPPPSRSALGQHAQDLAEAWDSLEAMKGR